ncbi:host specificity protein [Escherichia coli]|nr:host specificity protein [Escherichia coli]
MDFTLGSQGLRHTPGDIIEICDNDYAGTMTGGRILSIDAASRTLTLDREVTLPETGAATVNLINGTLPAVTASSPVPLCLHPGKHGRHLCHHGGAARTGKGSHRG